MHVKSALPSKLRGTMQETVRLLLIWPEMSTRPTDGIWEVYRLLSGQTGQAEWLPADSRYTTKESYWFDEPDDTFHNSFSLSYNSIH